MKDYKDGILEEIGEFGLIARLEKILRGTLSDGVVGIGDDCAILPAPTSENSLLLTTDTMVDGRHFRWGKSEPEDIGWKLLAVNLSDIAAAGGIPLAAIITLGMPASMETSDIERLYRGVTELATLHQVGLVGGDTVESDRLFLGATVLGRTENAVRRNGAQVGDDIWVSGRIGDGGLGLALSEGRIEVTHLSDHGAAAIRKLMRPEPRLKLGHTLSASRLSHSAVDISDGFIQDARHIAQASCVAMIMDVFSLPMTRYRGETWNEFCAMSAGDDYEILFTAAVEHRVEIKRLGESCGCPELTRVGRVQAVDSEFSADVFLQLEPKSIARSAAEVLRENGVPPQGGFSHFQTGV